MSTSEKMFGVNRYPSVDVMSCGGRDVLRDDGAIVGDSRDFDRRDFYVGVVADAEHGGLS